MEQMRLDFGEGAEAERAMETAARAARARAFEAAAVALGVRPAEVAYKLAGTLAVYADSPSQRAKGLTGLRWAGTWAELAADARLACSADSIAKAIRRFRAAGFITTTNQIDDRGLVIGVVVALEMRAINAAVGSENDAVGSERARVGSEPARVGSQTQSGPGSGPGAGAVTGPGSGPGKSSPHYIPVLPNYPNNPPPPNEPAAVDDFKHDWRTATRALTDAGVARVRPVLDAAKRIGITPNDVSDIVGEYAANRHLFRSPGAIVDRIRSGHWPIDIPDVAAVERRAVARRTAAHQLEFERARFAIIRAARAAGVELSDAEADRRAAAAAAVHREPMEVNP
jgi:hypothetical protein